MPALARPGSPGIVHDAPRPDPPREVRPLRLDEALDAWRDRLAEKLPFRLRMTISRLSPSAVEPPDVLVVPIPARYNGLADECDGARELIERALADLLGRSVSVRFARVEAGAVDDDPPAPVKPSTTRMAEILAADPWVQDVMRTFETAPFPFRVENEEEPPGR